MHYVVYVELKSYMYAQWKSWWETDVTSLCFFYKFDVQHSFAALPHCPVAGLQMVSKPHVTNWHAPPGSTKIGDIHNPERAISNKIPAKLQYL